MKFITILLLLTTTGFLVSAQSSKEYSGYVKYEGASAEGTVTVVSTGFGKNRVVSSEDALKQAFNTLLFQGIAGSQYELPMVGPEKKKDPAIRDLLEKEYRSFVIENNLQQEDKKTRTINCEALKRYLENKGVVRKFGI